MRIPRWIATVWHFHSYDLSDIFYHNGRDMVKLTRIRFKILCTFDLKLAGKKFVCGCSSCAMNECLLYALSCLKIRIIIPNIL